MEQVTGIGGVFFRSPDPEKLRAWYRDHLGLSSEQWGKVFQWAGSGSTTWGPFKDTSDYFPAEQRFMINYRVLDLDAMLAQLREAGARVDDKVEASEYGRFGWGFDCDGNRFELWQPPEGG